MRPRKSGNAKFTRPSHQKWCQGGKSAWFWLMGKSCPLQSAHPLGAEYKRDDTNLGKERFCHGVRWGDGKMPEERDDEIHAQEWRPVLVWLTAADRGKQTRACLRCRHSIQKSFVVAVSSGRFLVMRCNPFLPESPQRMAMARDLITVGVTSSAPPVSAKMKPLP